jgi:hypothetical protein
MKTMRQIATFASAVLAVSACAAQKPMLSSNDHLMRVGPSVAEQDIDQCIAYAEAGPEAGQTNKENPKGNPIADAATTSVAGAAAGGAGGAIFGNAGQGAAAGAISGVVGSLTYALLQARLFQRKPPEAVTRQIAERCLREKGYEPAGWK